MEGPLFSGIRGKGLSYGCGIYLSIWSGCLQFDVERASEPRKALIVFYDILEYINTPAGFADLCSEFNIDTARSMVSYNKCAGKSTATGNIASVLRNGLRGMSAEDQAEQEVILKGITGVDVKRVFDKYFMRFMGSERVTVCVGVPGESMEVLRKSFGEVPGAGERPYCGGVNGDEARFKVDMRVSSLDEFTI
jgi:Zn-dependent M16 (insulinase) family peptidase